jgi:hypothetical protein
MNPLVKFALWQKVSCPVTHDNVEYKTKQARIEGMHSQIDMNKILNIKHQNQMMKGQEESWLWYMGGSSTILWYLG